MFTVSCRVMGSTDEEAAQKAGDGGEQVVAREDSALKAAGHLRSLELVDDKVGKLPRTVHGLFMRRGVSGMLAEQHVAADAKDKGFFKNWRGGAGTWFDAWLTSAAAQVWDLTNSMTQIHSSCLAQTLQLLQIYLPYNSSCSWPRAHMYM